MSNRFFIILIALIVLVVGGFVVLKKDDGASTNSSVQPTNHIKGEGSTGVVLVEYGDFQCSACYQYEPIVQQLFEKYQQQIKFQFRHFPIVSAHPNAFSASRAAEAAAKQGKFWEMHDMLYQTQDPEGKTGWVASSNPLSIFEGFAQQLGMNVEQFKTDFASEEVNDLINADITAGKAVPASGTPTFVLDGKKIENPTSYEEFVKVIEEAIKAKTGQ